MEIKKVNAPFNFLKIFSEVPKGFNLGPTFYFRLISTTVNFFENNVRKFQKSMEYNIARIPSFRNKRKAKKRAWNTSNT